MRLSDLNPPDKIAQDRFVPVNYTPLEREYVRRREMVLIYGRQGLRGRVCLATLIFAWRGYVPS
jgi:hypothetical protein